MQLFSANVTMLKNAHENVKVLAQWHTYGSLDFFLSAASTAQNGPRLDIHIGNI